MSKVTTAVLVRVEDPLDVREHAAIAGFLAGYSGSTRTSYTTDLRLFASWCTQVIVLFDRGQTDPPRGALSRAGVVLS
jgi:hypothetical protein